MTTIEKIKSTIGISNDIVFHNETDIFFEFGKQKNFSSLPKNVQVLFLWMIIVKASLKNANFVTLVPENKEIYNIIFEVNINCLQYIENKTLLMCNIAFNKSPFAIKYIPNSFISPEMCDIALNSSLDLFKYIPIKYRSREMYKKYFEYIKDDKESILKEIKENDNEVVALEGYKANHLILPLLDKKYITKEICEIAFEEDINNIIYFPTELITDYMVEKSFKIDPNYIKYYPTGKITKQISETAFKKDKNNIKYIPKEHMNQNMCNEAFLVSHDYARLFPSEFITKDMSDLLFKDNIDYISIIPKKYITKEMCDNIYNEHKESLNKYFKYFPDEYKTKQMVDYLGADPKNSKYYPAKFLTKELINELLKWALSKEEEERLLRERKIIENAEKIEKYLKTKWNWHVGGLDSKDYSIEILINSIKERFPELYKQAITKFYKDNIEIIKEYINSDEHGKKSFIKNNYISESRFTHAQNFVKNFSPDLYDLFVEKAKENSSNYNDFSEKNVKYVKENVHKEDFNIITYYLNAGMNPVKLIYYLRKTDSQDIINEFKKKIFGRIMISNKQCEFLCTSNPNHVKKFRNTIHVINGVTYDREENGKLVEFLQARNVPLNDYTLSKAVELLEQGKLNIEDNSFSNIEYSKSNQLEEIRKKCSIIMQQDNIIEQLDNAIERLMEQIKVNDIGGESLGSI